MKTQHDGRGLAAFNIYPPTYMALNMPRDSEELRTRSRILTAPYRHRLLLPSFGDGETMAHKGKAAEIPQDKERAADTYLQRVATFHVHREEN